MSVSSNSCRRRLVYLVSAVRCTYAHSADRSRAALPTMGWDEITCEETCITRIEGESDARVCCYLQFVFVGASKIPRIQVVLEDLQREVWTNERWIQLRNIDRLLSSVQASIDWFSEDIARVVPRIECWLDCVEQKWPLRCELQRDLGTSNHGGFGHPGLPVCVWTVRSMAGMYTPLVWWLSSVSSVFPFPLLIEEWRKNLVYLDDGSWSLCITAPFPSREKSMASVEGIVMSSIYCKELWILLIRTFK